MSSGVNLVLMDAGRISRSLKRIAHEIAERNKDDRAIILFGIDERGFAIAGVLRDLLAPMFDNKVQVLQLPLKNGRPELTFEQLQSKEVRDQFLIAVDDVIFSGQTMFTALKKISETLNPSGIHTAVLIDRGHRKFPVKAEFCGIELPTKLNEHVSVIVKDGDIQEVILTNYDN